MRRVVRYFWMVAASVAALCVVLAVLVVAVALGFERERLRSSVEVLLEHTFNTEVSIGALEGHLLPGLVVRDLRIGPAEAPWLDVERASWRIRGFDFSERQIEIARLRLVGLRMHLDERGVERVATAPSAGATSSVSGLRLSVRGVELRDSEIDWIFSDACDGPCHIVVRGDAVAKRLAWPMSRGALEVLSGELAVDFEGVSPGQVAAEPRRFKGRARARFEHDALRVAAFELQVGGREIGLEEEAQIAVGLDHVDIENLRLRSGAATLRLHGGLQSDGFDGLALEARGVEAAQLAQLAPLRLEVAGRIDADLRLDGSFSRPRMRCDLRWEKAQIAGVPFDRILATLHAAEPSIELTLRAIQGPREIALADVTLPYAGALSGDIVSSPDATARMRSESLDVAILAPVLPGALRSLGGVARADLAWRGGTVPSLTGWVELDAGRIELPQIGDVLAPFHARAAFAPAAGGVRVESFSLVTAIGRVDGSGVIERSALRDTRLRLAGVAVAPLAKRLGATQEVGGRARAELTLEGPLARISATGNATWSEAHIGAARADRIALEIGLDAARLRGTARVQQAGRQTLQLRADLPRPSPQDLAKLLGPSAEIHVQADRFELAPWLALLPASTTPEELRSLGGLAQADLVWRGGAAPTLTGSLEIEAGRIELPHLDAALAPFHARAVLVAEPGGLATDSFTLETPIGRAEGRGAYARASLRGVQLRLDRVDVAGLATRLGVIQPMGGEAAAALSVEGPIERPEVHGNVVWSQARIATARAERVVLEIDADATRLRGVARVQEVGRDTLKLSADLPRPIDVTAAAWLGPGAAIDLSGEAFDLAALTPLLPRQLRDLRGRADLSLHLKGDAAGPQLAGELRISGGALTVPLLGQTFAPIEGRVQLVSQRLLPELVIGPPEARAVLSGTIALDGLLPASGDLALSFADFALARSRLLHLDVTGNLQLVGPVRALALLGMLRLERAQVRVPEAEDPVLREIRIATQSGTEGTLIEGAPVAPGAIDYARMDVGLVLPRNTWIRGRGIELELEGKLDLLKDPLGPVRYAGTVSTVRGRYTFLGKRFDVRSGSATFEGTDRRDPLIDVEAVHRVRDVDVLAHLTGHLSNPTLHLSSEPEYEESDVLALLLVGRPADELGERTGNFDAAATKLAAGIAANELSTMLRDYTPLDTLDVQIGEGGVPEEIGVGKYVWQDVFVRYGRTFGVDSKDKIGIEYRINENWSIESEMLTDQSAGADLVWSLDF
jgi:autotransporter translocation and assembly factor TamB